MKKNIHLLVMSLAMLTLGSGVAESALVYDLFLRVPTDRDGLDLEISANASEVFNASIILRETVTNGDASPLAASNLSGAAFSLSSNGANGSFRNFRVDGEGGSVGLETSDTGRYFALGVPIFNQPGKLGVVTGDGVREIQLGTVELIAPTMGRTTFLVREENQGADGNFGSFTTPSFESAARSTVGGRFGGRSLSLSVTAIPEPSSLAFLMAVGVVVTHRRRRRV